MEHILFSILMLAVVIGLGVHHVFLRRLRLKHPETWVALGSPSLILNNSIQNGFAVMRFLWKRQYKSLNDPALTKLCNFIVVYSTVYIVFFVGVIIFFLTVVIPSSSNQAE